MKENLKKLNEKIVQKRDQLNLAIENNEDEKNIYKKSIELDNLIADYIKYEKQEKVIEKYNYILNNPYRDDIINLIKNDVKKHIKNISDYELECYCNNVYVYACLKANNISKDEIAKQILYRNNLAAEKLEGLDSNMNNMDLQFNIDISNKYYEIVKDKLKLNES